MPLTSCYGFGNAPTSAIIGDSSLAWTTATGALAAAGTALTVASSSAFPAALEFDVIIGLRDTTTGIWSNAEVRHVTVVSGTTWTVSAGSLNHASGESISLTLTAEGLKHNPGALTDTGDMPYLLSTGRMGRLAAPSNGTYSVAWLSGVPTWTAAGSGGISFADLATPPGGTALGSIGFPYSVLQIGSNLTYSLDATSILRLHTSDVNLAGDFRNGYWSQMTYAPTAGTDNGSLANINIDAHFGGTGSSNGQLSNILALAFHEGVGSLGSILSETAGINVTGGGTLGYGEGFGAVVNVTNGSTVTDGIYLFSIDTINLNADVGSYYGFWANGPSHSIGTLGNYYSFYISDHESVGAVGNNDVFYYGGGKFVVHATGAVVTQSTVTATDFIVSGSRFKSDTVDGHTAGLAGYDVDNTTYRDILTWTNGNAVAAVLATPTGGTLSGEFSTLTLNSAAVATQTYVGAQGFITGSGNAATATALQNARTINGTSFNGTANITVTADASTLTGTSLTATVLGSSLTSVGTIATGVWSGTAIAAAKGGTGQTVYVVGDLLQASTTTALSTLASIATGNALISGGTGTVSSWGKVGLTTHVSGVLPVANGGTNASSASITAFNNITGLSAAGTTGTTSTNLVFSTSPSFTTPALGVATATSLNGNTFTTGTYTLTGQAGKTLAFNGSITVTGTDAQTYTFPTTSATIARTDAAQTFSGIQTFQVSAANKFIIDGSFIRTNTALLILDNGAGSAGAVFESARFNLATGTSIGWSPDSNAYTTADTFIKRASAAVFQFGLDVNGAAVSQTLQAASGIAGTDKTGGNFTIASGKGTGAGAVSSLIFQTPTALGSGTTAQSLTTRLTIDVNGIKATGYLSSDGSAGVTAGPFTTITSITVKNGLITALTGA